MAQDAIINRWDINGDIYDIQDAGRGRPLGVATLDENGRIPYAQLPESAVEFKGYWNANTNTPTLQDGTGTKGDLYYTDVAGTQDLGSGSQYFNVGDRVLYDGSIWKNISAIDISDSVADDDMRPVTSNAVFNGGNTVLSALPDWTADPTDTTKLIRQDTGGTASFGKVTFLTVWNYIKSKIQNVGSLVIGIASTVGTKLKLKGMTYGTNTYTDNNPKIVFENTDASQNVSLTFTDYDAVQSPASLTLNGNQGGEYFIAPNIKATTRFYGALTGNVTGNCSGSSGSCTGNAATATSATSATSASYSSKVVGTYTGSGGQQNPQYVGKTRVCFNMMNTTVNGNSQYKDWLMMDCYSGFDVGGTVALGVNRQSLGAYIMRANAGTSPNRPTTWAESAELIHTKNILNILYPIGAIYITLSSADFSNFLGGTWVKINDGSFIRASGGNAGTVGQVQAEGLPNITGSIKGTGYSIGTNTGATNSGALTGSDFNMKAASGTSSSAVYMSKISFDASNGNSTVPDGASSGKIYGNSSHVTPRNIAVYMWKRTA